MGAASDFRRGAARRVQIHALIAQPRSCGARRHRMNIHPPAGSICRQGLLDLRSSLKFAERLAAMEEARSRLARWIGPNCIDSNVSTQVQTAATARSSMWCIRLARRSSFWRNGYLANLNWFRQRTTLKKESTDENTRSCSFGTCPSRFPVISAQSETVRASSRPNQVLHPPSATE